MNHGDLHLVRRSTNLFADFDFVGRGPLGEAISDDQLRFGRGRRENSMISRYIYGAERVSFQSGALHSLFFSRASCIAARICVVFGRKRGPPVSPNKSLENVSSRSSFRAEQGGSGSTEGDSGIRRALREAAARNYSRNRARVGDHFRKALFSLVERE